MRISGNLEFYGFRDQEQPLNYLSETPQKQYLIQYLADLDVGSTVVEPSYFDKDYLDEFSVYYSRSSQCYVNICRRVHFFSGEPVSREQVRLAASGDLNALESLQDRYCGFIVLRPIPIAPLGRTVLKLYPDRTPGQPRITTPSRRYKANITGIELSVDGLAWQQQDTGVAACATVSLWTMLHSSAYDEHHSIPTTAQITQSAQSFGRRPFPSTGLTLEQILEAIHKQNLNPIAVSGDSLANPPIPALGRLFSKDRFANNVAAFVRSGYPVLVVGHYEGSSGHAICIGGFRDRTPDGGAPGSLTMADKDIDYVYIHDDNKGPNIRFKIESGEQGQAKLVSSPPEYLESEQEEAPHVFYPYSLIAATHQDVRISADELYEKGFRITSFFVGIMNAIFQHNNIELPQYTFSPRFILLRDYFSKELGTTLSGDVLGAVRLALQEKVPPMSLHLGVVRLGANGDSLLMDLLYDTTDSGRNIPLFTAVVYDPAMYEYLRNLLLSPELDQIMQGISIIDKSELPMHLIPAFER
jgi:hypothetical protein